MSGQWEVVGKNKKDKQSGKNKKMSKDEKKKFVDNAPKVEDLIPLSQVKTLYAALDTNKEPPKPIEKAIKTKENEAGKKVQKKPKEKKEPVKENKPPKTIEAAVALITAADVQNVLEVGQMRFPDAPLVWLKGFASWLNTKLPVDQTDTTFTAKSWEYPLCQLHPEIRSVLKKALKEVPDSAIQMFYDYCLTSMANDMTKGSPVTGYKMLLQLVASQMPSVTVADLAKAATLRHSYQNRPAIGCSVMWALGQGGFKDICTGLQVWQHVMQPVYQLRHYTHFVTDYLRHLLARHSTSKAVTVAHYLSVLDTVFSCPHPPNQELKNHLRTLQRIVWSSQSDSLHNVFESMLTRLSPSCVPALREEVARFLTHCLATDPQCWGEWRHLYTKCQPQSAVLLRHLNADWNSLSSQLALEAFKDTLRTFKSTNDILVKQKQRAEGLQECTRLTEALLGKMLEAKKPFPWKTIVFLVFLAIAGVVAYDTKLHNGFKGSKTGVFLRDIGALKYGEQAFSRVQDMSVKLYRWSEVNVPVYTAQVRTVLGPYWSLAMDIISSALLQIVAATNIAWTYCVDKKPLIEQWMNQYAPGLAESITLWAKQAWGSATHYGLQAGTLALKYLSFTVEWLRDNVFVGRLSPENLHRVTLEALNTTQTLAAQTMSWINNKMIASGAEKV